MSCTCKNKNNPSTNILPFTPPHSIPTDSLSLSLLLYQPSTLQLHLFPLLSPAMFYFISPSFSQTLPDSYHSLSSLASLCLTTFLSLFPSHPLPLHLSFIFLPHLLHSLLSYNPLSPSPSSVSPSLVTQNHITLL